MENDKSPLDFDSASGHGEPSGDDPARRAEEAPPRRRPGHVFGEGGDGESEAEKLERIRDKWRPGAATPGRGLHEDFRAAPTRLEISTPLEWLLAGASAGFLMISFALTLEGLSRSSSATPFSPALPGAIGAAGIALFLVWLKTDNHYLTNPARRTIDYHFQCLSFEWTSPHLKGSTVEIVAVDCVAKSCKPRRGRTRHWKEYTVYAWHRDGGWTRLTDAIKDDLLSANHLAREAAGALGCAFGAGGPEIIYLRGGSGKVEAVDISDDWFGLRRYPIWTFGLAAAAMLGGIAILLATTRIR